MDPGLYLGAEPSPTGVHVATTNFPEQFNFQVKDAMRKKNKKNKDGLILRVDCGSLDK